MRPRPMFILVCIRALSRSEQCRDKAQAFAVSKTHPEQAGISHFASEREYFFEEGCFVNELSNSEDDPAMSVALIRLPAGKTTRWHKLAHTTERYVILSGEGIVELGDMPPSSVSRGDVVLIPPDVAQRIHSDGSHDLEFLALCTPRFQKQNYRDLED